MMLNGSQSLSLYNGFGGNFCLVHGMSIGMWHVGTTFVYVRRIKEELLEIVISFVFLFHPLLNTAILLMWCECITLEITLAAGDTTHTTGMHRKISNKWHTFSSILPLISASIICGRYRTDGKSAKSIYIQKNKLVENKIWPDKI